MKHTELGNIGETTVLNHLKKKGFRFVERNYRKKWGEIDLILQKGKKIHFVEVKTVSCENFASIVSRETTKSMFSRGNSESESLFREDIWRPEENVHQKKLQKLHRTIQTWLSERNYTGAWQLDVVSVRLSMKHRRGTIKIISDVVSE